VGFYVELKKELHSEGYVFVDGYSYFGSDFSLEDLQQAWIRLFKYVECDTRLETF